MVISRRSVLDLEEHKTLNKDLRDVWGSFIADLMTMFLEAYGKGEKLKWSCSFNCLINDYVFRKPCSRKIKNDENCVTFDEFLFSKISITHDWRSCNNLDEFALVKKWCLAWFRISKKFGEKVSTLCWSDVQFDKTRSKSYLRDVEILIKWLAIKMKANNCLRNHKGDLKKLLY